MGSSLPSASTDSGTSMPIESGEESISSMKQTGRELIEVRQLILSVGPTVGGARVRLPIVAASFVICCGVAGAQTVDRVTARDNVVVATVLQDLLTYRGKDSPLDGPFGPSTPLPLMRTPLRGPVSMSGGGNACGIEEKPWRTLTETQQRATEQAARDLERRAPRASGLWDIAMPNVTMHEESARPRNELGLHGGIDVSLPGYSVGGRIAVVLVTMPWSIHSAMGTYVLRHDDDGWRVLLREYAYTM